MSYELKKPYDFDSKYTFISNYNRGTNQLKIVETDYSLYALEPNEMMTLQDVEEEIQVEVEPAVYETVEIPAVTETIQVQIFDESGEPVLDEEGNPTFKDEVIEIEPARTEEKLVKEAVYETQTVTVQRYVPVINPNYEQEQAQRERERISRLFLTAADVERGLYKALGKDFDDIIAIASTVEGVDVKALKIELKANNFYRGNPYVSQMGALLGLTETQLDEFFMTNDYTKLLGDLA